jgi:MtN3 and saliva related transmembrane protein
MLLLLLRQAGTEDILVSLIGVAAAVLTTSSFVPQIIKGYRTKSMEDVSRYLMSLFATGTVLWMVYGIYKSDWVIIVGHCFQRDTALLEILVPEKSRLGVVAARRKLVWIIASALIHKR